MQSDDPYFKDVALSLRVLSLNEHSVKLIAEMKLLELEMEATVAQMKRQVADAPPHRRRSEDTE